MIFIDEITRGNPKKKEAEKLLDKFLNHLRENDVRFEAYDDVIMVKPIKTLNFNGFTEIPPNVRFESYHNIHIEDLEVIPRNTIFNGISTLYADNVKHIDDNVIINVGNIAYLQKVETIGKDVMFQNAYCIFFNNINRLSTHYSFFGVYNVMLTNVEVVPKEFIEKYKYSDTKFRLSYE